MNTLRAIDVRIVALHHSAAARFGKEPAAAARLCVIAQAVLTLLWAALSFDPSRGFGWVALACSASIPALLSHISRTPDLFSAIGGMPAVRLVAACGFLVEVFGLSVGALSAGLRTASALAAFSFFYFAACAALESLHKSEPSPASPSRMR